MLLSSVLPGKISQAWNSRQIQLSPGTVSSFYPFTLISLLVPVVLFVCHQLGLLGTDPHAVGVEALSKRSTEFASSSSSPAKPSMSSSEWRLVIALPAMLTMLSLSSKECVTISFRNVLKRMGVSRHPCRASIVVRN